ncbi:MAG: hypothetical protein F4W95_10630 [Chloroflexi bacterium]|nr:hypothetical protein [Chloroflexota bacterium]MYD48926.1 hypothetical protein [Chloroflexota bacterium]
MYQRITRVVERFRNAWVWFWEEFWLVPIMLLSAATVVGLDSLLEPLPDGIRRMFLATIVAFLAWATGYLPMLNRARRRREEAEARAALAEERRDAEAKEVARLREEIAEMRGRNEARDEIHAGQADAHVEQTELLKQILAALLERERGHDGGV